MPARFAIVQSNRAAAARHAEAPYRLIPDGHARIVGIAIAAALDGVAFVHRAICERAVQPVCEIACFNEDPPAPALVARPATLPRGGSAPVRATLAHVTAAVGFRWRLRY